MAEQPWEPDDWGGVPEHLRPGLARYIAGGCPVGDFLRAALSNDLAGAIRKADDVSLAALPALIRFLHWNAPGGCWASPEAYQYWVACGGLAGKAASDETVEKIHVANTIASLESIDQDSDGFWFNDPQTGSTHLKPYRESYAEFAARIIESRAKFAAGRDEQ